MWINRLTAPKKAKKIELLLNRKSKIDLLQELAKRRGRSSSFEYLMRSWEHRKQMETLEKKSGRDFVVGTLKISSAEKLKIHLRSVLFLNKFCFYLWLRAESFCLLSKKTWLDIYSIPISYRFLKFNMYCTLHETRDYFRFSFTIYGYISRNKIWR